MNFGEVVRSWTKSVASRRGSGYVDWIDWLVGGYWVMELRDGGYGLIGQGGVT